MDLQNSVEARYDRLSEKFFELYYTYHPPHATRIGMEIHLQTRTLAQAAEWMERKAGIMSASAYGLLDRAVYYPAHLTYHIGCEMVRKLRADYEAARSSDFVLQEFHDRFMTYGLIPPAVIRQDMLGAADDGILF